MSKATKSITELVREGNQRTKRWESSMLKCIYILSLSIRNVHGLMNAWNYLLLVSTSVKNLLKIRFIRKGVPLNSKHFS